MHLEAEMVETELVIMGNQGNPQIMSLCLGAVEAAHLDLLIAFVRASEFLFHGLS